MADRNRLNIFKEKLILQEEEKSLKRMLDKFQDQLNRLKIEELALVHLLRMQTAKESQPDTAAGPSHAPEHSQTSHKPHTNDEAKSLSSFAVSGDRIDLEYIDDEEEEDDDNVADMIPVGYLQQALHKTVERERVNDINQESLDLEVSHAAGLFGEDMEEEEEEEEDSENDNDGNMDAIAGAAGNGNEDNQSDLRSFMDNF